MHTWTQFTRRKHPFESFWCGWKETKKWTRLVKMCSVSITLVICRGVYMCSLESAFWCLGSTANVCHCRWNTWQYV